jgi:hypothetical protein
MLHILSLKKCLAVALTIGLFASTASAQEEQAPSAPAKAEPTKAEPVKPASPAKAMPTEAAPAAGQAKARPLSVTVGLSSNATIEGTLTDTNQLQMQTSFGTASIPLSEVAGIKFASANDATTTVVMLNGDSITGATDVKLITVETEWGTASINGPSISSIMFVPGLTWNPQDGLNGKRWSLADVKPKEVASPTTARPRDVTGTGTGTGSRPPGPVEQFPQQRTIFPAVMS